MSDYLNFSLQTRDQVADWVLKKLGWPLIQIEITSDQIDIALNDAVEEFTEYVIQERQYLVLALSAYSSVSGFTLPNNVQSIFALEECQAGPLGGINTLFSVKNQLYNEGLYPPFMPGGGWITYELSLQYIEMVQRMTASKFYFEYDQRAKRMTLIPDPNFQDNPGWIVVGCNVIRKEDQQYGETWVKRMTLAFAKQIIGQVRSKFNGTQLLAGAQINQEIKQEGITEMDALRIELRERYSFVTFYVG
jgi:hypothetical protein